MLGDTVEVEDKMLQFDKQGNPLNDQNLLIDLDEKNFSKLRAHQRSHLHKSIKQEHSLNLAQND